MIYYYWWVVFVHCPQMTFHTQTKVHFWNGWKIVHNCLWCRKITFLVRKSSIQYATIHKYGIIFFCATNWKGWYGGVRPSGWDQGFHLLQSKSPIRHLHSATGLSKNICGITNYVLHICSENIYPIKRPNYNRFHNSSGLKVYWLTKEMLSHILSIDGFS